MQKRLEKLFVPPQCPCHLVYPEAHPPLLHTQCLGRTSTQTSPLVTEVVFQQIQTAKHPKHRRDRSSRIKWHVLTIVLGLPSAQSLDFSPGPAWEQSHRPLKDLKQEESRKVSVQNMLSLFEMFQHPFHDADAFFPTDDFKAQKCKGLRSLSAFFQQIHGLLSVRRPFFSGSNFTERSETRPVALDLQSSCHPVGKYWRALSLGVRQGSAHASSKCTIAWISTTSIKCKTTITPVCSELVTRVWVFQKGKAG